MSPFNITIIGGSGFWSDQNHIKNILAIASKNNVAITDIIDIVDPSTVTRHAHLQEALALFAPQWVDAGQYRLAADAFEQLSHAPDLVIISSNPETHFPYAEYCIKNNIPCIIDKPILTVNNASMRPDAAMQIESDFRAIVDAYHEYKTPVYSILRRRSLPAFTKIAKELSDGFRATGAPITHMSVAVNGGIHKFPIEFEKNKGAHSYQQGVGSLAHSAYHYIDVMTWFIESAPGTATHINVKLNYVRRVSDYLATRGYAYIQNFLDIPDDKIGDVSVLNEAILAAELDSSFTLELLDDQERNVGSALFTFNHTTFSPRQRGIELNGDHANFEGGGRMSQIYIDVHQSTIQNWHLTKNDVVFNGNSLSLTGRRHPAAGPAHERIDYTDAYDQVEVSMADLLAELIASLAGSKKQSAYASIIKPIDSELVNMLILSRMYQLIAADYTGGALGEGTLIEIPRATSGTTQIP